jgi:hypothetical protein
MRRIPALVTLIALLSVTAACGGGSGGGGGTPSPSAARPPSPAVVRILQPAAGSTLTGTTVHVVIAVEGATIVQQTTTDIHPDQGHVHLFLDGSLIYMNYTLQQDVPVHPGNYELHAEFVASDHFPFNPRVLSTQVLFTVK